MNICIKNISALLHNENRYEIKKSDIYITDNIISGIDEKPQNFVTKKTIDGENKLIIPGLINCHTHTYMSLFRNLADDLSFEDWLFKNIMPREDKLTPEDAYYGAMLACIEMIKTGTTTFLDMHMFKNQTLKAADQTGMRAIISRGLVGSDRNDEGGIQRIDEAKEEIQNWKSNDRFSFMLAPHAIYTCGTDYLSYIIEIAKQENLPLNIHLSETRNEVEECKKNHNMTPVEYLNNLGFFDQKTVAAHCVHLEGNDIDILSSKNVSVAANPMSNLKLGNGFAPIPELMKKGVCVCIGTDSAASNNTLNMFSDMNYTALIHKGTHENSETISAADVLNFATVNGAKALNLKNIGSIKQGMKADLAILDLKCPQFNPRNNLVSALAYSANGSEVETVIIDGNIVLENRKMVNIDENEIYSKSNEIIKRLNL